MFTNLNKQAHEYLDQFNSAFDKVEEEHPFAVHLGRCFMRGAAIGACARLVAIAAPPLAPLALGLGFAVAMVDGMAQAEKFEQKMMKYQGVSVSDLQ